jgi:hypothetical protein
MSVSLRGFYVLIGLCVGLGALPARAASKWMKIQTDDFVILSEAGERDMVEFAVGYSAFRQTLRDFFRPATSLPPSTVLLFRRQDLMEPYLPVSKERNTTLVTFSTEVDAEALVALSLDGDRAKAMELTYEFEGGWMLRRMGYFLPLWMSQGTGEVLGSLTWRKGKSTIGHGPEHLSDLWRRNSALPWKRFFELTYGASEYSGPNADGVAQAQSWALMHRVLLDGPGGKERFDALSAKLRTTPAMEAVEAVLGVPAKDFTKDVERHLSRRDAFRETPFDDAKVRASLKVIPAEEAEVRVHLSDLLIAARKPNEAEVEFARARAAAPDSPAVKEWLARRELRRNEPDEAARLYREAIAAGSRNSVAYLVSARVRMNASRSSNVDRAGGGGRDLEESIAEIRQSIRLNPGSAEAYQQLGRAFFLSPQLTDENIVELSRGIVPGADGGQMQLYRAMLYNRLNRSDEYLADLRQLATIPATAPHTKKYAQERLEGAEFKVVQSQVEKLVKEKSYATAHEMIVKARGRPPKREDEDSYAQLDVWISRYENWDKVRALLAEKKWAECREAAKAFLEDYPLVREAPEVRRIDAQAARMLKEQN